MKPINKMETDIFKLVDLYIEATTEKREQIRRENPDYILHKIVFFIEKAELKAAKEAMNNYYNQLIKL